MLTYADVQLEDGEKLIDTRLRHGLIKAAKARQDKKLLSTLLTLARAPSLHI